MADSRAVEPSHPAPGFRRTAAGRWMAPLALVFLTFAFFYQPLILGRAFYVFDLSLAYLPVQIENARLRAAGEFPLWNQYLFMGYPITAEAEVGGLYPPALVFNLPLSPERAYAIYLTFHYMLAFAAVLVLGREFGLSPPARTVAAMVFSFGGTFVSQTVNLPLVTTFAWAPLILGLQVRAMRTGAIGPALWAGVCLGLQILGMHPQMTFYTGLLMALAAVVRPGTEGKAGGLGIGAGMAGLILLVGIGLGAPQLFYSWSLVGQLDEPLLDRYDYVTSFSFFPTYLLQLLIPDLFGVGEHYVGTEFIEEQRCYAGLIPLALVLAGWRGKGRAARYLRLLLIASVALAFGRFVFVYHVLDRVPGFDLFRAPVRWMFPAMLAVGLLAGRGLDHPSDGKRGRFTWLDIGCVVTALGLVTVAVLANRASRAPATAATSPVVLRAYSRLTDWGLRNRANHVRSHDPERFGEMLPAALADCGRSAGRTAIAAGLAAIWFAVVRVRGCSRLAVVACVILVGTDLWSAGRHTHRFAPGGYYSRSADHIDLYRNDPTQFRVMSVVERRTRDPDPVGLSCNFGSLYQVQVLDGFPSRDLRAMNRFKGEGLTAAQLNMAGVKYFQFPFPIDVDSPPRQLASLELTGIQSGPEWYVYENRSVLPRVILLGEYEVMRDDETMFVRLKSPSFDPAQTVVLSSEPHWDDAGSSEATHSDAARITEYRGQSVRIRTESRSPAVLVLFDFFYPGWRATLDGETVEVLRADGIFRAVCVPAGAHEVVFRFRPASFYAGFAVAVATVALLAARTLLQLRHRRAAA